MKKDEIYRKETESNGITRREFVGGCAAVTAGAILASNLDFSLKVKEAQAQAGNYPLNKPENQIYSVCLQCNTGCGIKVKILDGVAVKIDGNPYNPWNMVPNISANTDLKEAAKIDAAICPRGQSGIQSNYDPYRITKVLKRAGKRGENKWITIPFSQAIDEIVNGGKLFAHVPGEENRVVEGLKDLYVVKDSALFSRLDKAINDIFKAKDKKQAVEEFKAKNPDLLPYLIDPDHPDLGFKNNQVVYMWGRKKAGRSQFFQLFFRDYFGTTNAHGHTTVCQGSLYFACKAISEQWQYNKWGGGQKFYWQADLLNSKFVLFVGANLFEGNYGPTNRTVRLTERLAKGEIQIAVADPRFNKLASKAKYYLPIKPGTDAALFMAIMNWMFANDRIDKKFLSAANKLAAEKTGEDTWTNATLLVKIDDKGKPGKLLRTHEIGLGEPVQIKDKDGKEYTLEFFVAMDGKLPVGVDFNNDYLKQPVFGELFVDTTLDDGKGGKIRVKSALQILKEEVMSKSIDEWAKICECPKETIIAVAKELADAGKKGAVDVHRGVSQHTNGFYNVVAAMSVNMLLGNFDAAGGSIVPATYSIGDPTRDLKGKVTPTGISSIRHDVKYEETTLFSGYPAKRNWWPLASDIYEEIIPSIGDKYPYPVKALFMYMGAPTYALPAGQTNIDILVNTDVLPLFVASDIIIGSTSMYADYIFPDLTYLERWEFHGSHPNMASRVQPIRQPVVASPNEVVKVFGEEQPISFETVLLAFAEKLGMKGFGKNAFGEGKDFTRPDDLYIRFVVNLAKASPVTPDASDEEIKIFLEARKHLPKNVFDPERWQKIAGADWRKVVYLLNRGGKFQEYADVQKAINNGKVPNPWKKSINLYQEKTAGTKDSFTGKSNPGYAKYIPVAITTGKSLEEAGLTQGYDLHLITQRDITQTKSRTVTNYWLLSVYPENSIVINPLDAKKYGLKQGDKVQVMSATNKEGVWDLKHGNKKPMIGKVFISETIRPGVITFTLGHGHFATGASDQIIDGVKIKGDPRRAAGIHANAAMLIDPYLKNTCLLDPVGGSAVFYDTKVTLKKV
ncbi:MAG: molybdopterin-dependent oxidoreductase [Calditerrivibrio sp.]|nr:molybdopterin-dependent oxidoreductase [Calditerrivibrio sp.]